MIAAGTLSIAYKICYSWTLLLQSCGQYQVHSDVIEHLQWVFLSGPPSVPKYHQNKDASQPHLHYLNQCLEEG